MGIFRMQQVSVIAPALLMLSVSARATNLDSAVWPGWRGDGSARSASAKAPLHWNSENGIAWKTHLPGEGNSSPVIWHDRVFVTASAEEGLTRLIIGLDAHKGDILWQYKIKGENTKTYPKSGRASPTPVTDGDRVYAFFDSPGLVAVDRHGNEVWRAALGPFNNMYNMASSPILAGNTVVINCDHSGPSFIAAFDKVTGDERWRTPREGGTHYATPTAFTHEERTQIVVNGKTIVSYDAATGEKLWWCHGMKHATTPTTLYHNGLVYATCGRNGPSMTIDPGGSGDVTDTHVRMHVRSGGPYVPSPLVIDGTLVVPGDNGRMLFVNSSGKVVAKHRLKSKIRKFSASPIDAGGHIYWPDESGQTFVIRVGGLDTDAPQVDVVAVNPLDEECMASPAAAHGRLYIRTAKNLYCVAGGDVKYKSLATATLPDDFAKLKALYDAEPKGELDNTNLRMAMIVKFAGYDHDEAIAVLAGATRNEHWDISEEAVRALGRYGERAVDHLLELFKDGRPFIKTVAAGNLAQIKPPGAVPTLIAAAKANERQVRMACIEALGEIAAEHEQTAGDVAAALVEFSVDGEGVIRHASVEALTRLAPSAGDFRPLIVAALRRRLADSHALTAEAAKIALENAYEAALEAQAPSTADTVAPGGALVELFAAAGPFEGPSWHPDTGKLYFCAFGGAAPQILRLDESGKTSVWADDTGGANGTFVAADGSLLAALYLKHQVVRYDLTDDGSVAATTVLAENAQWHQPNDICQAPNGDIYFTDPDWGARKTSAVYRLDGQGDVTKVVTDMATPNGVLVSIDGRTLYVSDSYHKWWRAYPIGKDGSIGPGRVYHIAPTAEQRTPDGMTTDAHGNVYFTGGSGVCVVSAAGKSLGVIPVPQFVTNVTMGGPKGHTLYLTCRQKVYSLAMRVAASGPVR